jgi:hypothetical protein
MFSKENLEVICQDKAPFEATGEKVDRISFAALDAEDNAYFGIKFGITYADLTDEIVQECIKALPDKDVFPEYPDGGQLTIAPEDVAGRYVKRPAWGTLLDLLGPDFVPKMLLQEAFTLEHISKHPHPNIVGYHGCRVKRGRIVGLVLETFTFTNDLGFAKAEPAIFKGRINKEAFMSDIRAALDHIHALGWAHNDLKPDNIMFGEGNKAVLIDFGSCQPFGSRLMSCGTPGWYEKEFYLSDKSHDEYSFKMLGPWLDELIIEIENSQESGEEIMGSLK